MNFIYKIIIILVASAFLIFAVLINREKLKSSVIYSLIGILLGICGYMIFGYLNERYFTRDEYPDPVSILKDIHFMQIDFKEKKIKDIDSDGIGEYAQSLDELVADMQLYDAQRYKEHYYYKVVIHTPENVDERENYYEIHVMPGEKEYIKDEQKLHYATVVMFPDMEIRYKYLKGEDVSIYEAKQWKDVLSQGIDMEPEEGMPKTPGNSGKSGAKKKK